MCISNDPSVLGIEALVKLSTALLFSYISMRGQQHRRIWQFFALPAIFWGYWGLNILGCYLSALNLMADALVVVVGIIFLLYGVFLRKHNSANNIALVVAIACAVAFLVVLTYEDSGFALSKFRIAVALVVPSLVDIILHQLMKSRRRHDIEVRELLYPVFIMPSVLVLLWSIGYGIFVMFLQ